MHPSRMRTTCCLLYGGWGGVCDKGPPGQRPPRQRPRGQRPHWTENPWKEHRTRDRDPIKGTWDQTAKQDVTSYRDLLPLVNRMTDTCL